MSIQSFCIIAMAVSLTVFFAFVAMGILLHRRRIKKLKQGKRIARAPIPFYLTVGGFFFAAVIMYYPIYYFGPLSDQNGFVRFLNAVLLGMQNVLRLFTLNGEFGNVIDFINLNFGGVASGMGTAYSVYMAIILVTAPALTAGFLISFFREVSSYLKYLLYPRADLYILSELNEFSVALAEDITSSRSRHDNRRLIVFTDVFEKNEEENYELIARAKGLGAICLRKDIGEVRLKPWHKGIKRKFYFISENFDKNLGDCLSRIQHFKGARYDDPSTELYLFSDNMESEALLNSVNTRRPVDPKDGFGRERPAIPVSERYTIAELLAFPKKGMKIRRISENRNLVISTLRGTWLFDRAKRTGGHIKVALVGLGGYGRELLKALCWYTQIPGYTIEIHVFDASAEAQSRIECLAPELMERNGKVEEGECAYSIFFHCPIEVEDKRFTEEFGKVAEGLTAVFVTLGNDEKNIETAMRVRTQLGRMTTDPQALPAIYAVVYSTAKNEVAEGAEGNALADIRGNSYGIAFIGDLRTRYSLASIEHMELETLAQCCHMQYAATRISKRDPDAERRVSELIENYERYEYYRRTAIGQAVYLEALVKLGLAATRESEHNRWNAFMRAEGFLHSTRRDDIAKLHPDLVSFGRLSESDRRRDDVLQLYAIVSEYVHTGKLPQRKS